MASQDWLEKDFYQILGVAKDVDDAALKKTYRKLARKYRTALAFSVLLVMLLVVGLVNATRQAQRAQDGRHGGRLGQVVVGAALDRFDGGGDAGSQAGQSLRPTCAGIPVQRDGPRRRAVPH